MKREHSKARKLGIQKKIEEWCELNKLQPDADGIIAFDKANPTYKLLDHDKAQREGYFTHLRMQATTLIASWATVVPLVTNAGSVPFSKRERPDAPVKVQEYYGGKKLSKMSETELDRLIDEFQFFIRNKTVRVHHFLNLKDALQENRGRVQQAMKDAEESAYNSVVAAAKKKKAA